jgi:hypothetical protein
LGGTSFANIEIRAVQEESLYGKTDATTSKARAVAPTLMGAGSIAYSGPWNRIGSVSSMPSDICRRAMTSDRHAVDAFLPNIEPDAGKNLDALAEAKPHTQFSTTSENAVSFKVDRSIDTETSCILSFMRVPHSKSTSSDLALGRAHAKTPK